MFTQKAMYYPSLEIATTETRFGSMIALNHADLYEKSLPSDRNIYRIDLLYALRDYWGESIVVSRDNIYKLVSGDTTDVDYRKLIATYYRTHAAFACYVDEIYMFGDSRRPFITQFVESVRGILNTELELKRRAYVSSSGKELLLSKEYLYFSMPLSFKSVDMKGIKVI